MPDALSSLEKAGVLGMNRRNADFIMRYNSRSAFPLVDDKVLTKGLAERYQIPTPPTYRVVERNSDIAGLEKELSGIHDFALKPARGAGGSGILLVTDRKPEGLVKPSGKVISWEDFTFHISNILSGIYSLGGLPDRAIIEGLLHPGPVFAAISYLGIPDIRIVVYRGVPVMAMVRLPTKASDGKANLHLGGIGAGIDIGTGQTLNAVLHSRTITHHPETGNPVKGIEVPYWNRMLLMAALAQDMTGLGYLGVDLVIDRDHGPLLLELNARPGLAIQMANHTGLFGRLKVVEEAPPEIFVTPEARAGWATQTFTAA
ncbi:MAG: alpha-L-glutamate ligase-like protein [Candidatus Binatia bacterium]